MSSEGHQDLSEQSCSWKSKLSAALNDEQIFFSLLLLGIFYVGYTAAKADFDASDMSIDDDERFVQSCYCSLHQRTFFRSWFGLFCVIWFIIHTYTFFAPFLTKKHKWYGNITTGILAGCSILLECFCCVWPCPCGCSDCPCRKDDDDIPNVSQNQPADLVSTKKLESNIRLLWSQYCKLYVAGYAKDDEKVIISKTSEDQTDSGNGHEENCFLEYSRQGKVSCLCCLKCTCTCTYHKEDSERAVEKSCAICCFKCNKRSYKIEDNNQNDDCVCCNKPVTCPNISMMCFQHYFPGVLILKGVIRVFLFLIKYLSQLVTVPLLLLQIFDTYSLLCFSPDLYCSNTSEYKLHLAQAAITLLFYCSLTLSQLISTMLAWNPWPKDEQDS